MKIMGIETSSNVASIAIVSRTKLIAEYTINNKRTHSEKMMGALDTLLEASDISLSDIDAIAVSKGPGSFTGIRIGMASAQGMAHSLGVPMIGVNALDGLAFNIKSSGNIICPVINAQRGDVYTALYKFEAGKLNRLTDYKIIGGGELCDKLYSLDDPVSILGDGVPVLLDILKETSHINLAHTIDIMPRGSSIASLGLEKLSYGKVQNCFTIEPFYIRKSYAEESWEERHGGKS